MRELYHAYLYTADFENLSSTHLQTGGMAPALRGDVGALLESALDFNGCNASTIDDAKILALWVKMKNLKRGDFDLRVRAGAPSLIARGAAQHGGYGRSRQHGSVLPAWPKGWGGPRECFRSVLPGLEPARARFKMRKA